MRRILRVVLPALAVLAYAAILALTIDERGSRHREPERATIRQNLEVSR